MYGRARPRIRHEYQRALETGTEFGGFVVMQSLAGGTGSGVGARVVECLRGEYPHAFITGVVVWPFQSDGGGGEVSVQAYNAVLALSKLYPVRPIF